MAKRKRSGGKSCTREHVKFKTKRGRKLDFMARRGGSAVCGPRKLSSAQRSWRAKFARTARGCTGGTVKMRARCVQMALK